MFQFLQNHTKKMLIVFCVPIILSFVLYFNIGTLSDQSNPAVAEMFGKPVSLLDFQKAYQAIVKEEEGLRYEVPAKTLIPYMKHEDQAFFRLMLLKKAKDLNIQISDKELQEELVKTFAGLQGKDKPFDVKWYENFILSNLRISPIEFEAMMRDSISIQKLQEAIQVGVTLSDSEAEEFYKEENARIEFSYAELTNEILEKKVLITDPALEIFYNQNPDVFAIPEEVKLQYLYSKNERFKDKVSVSDQEIQKYYDEHRDTFKLAPEQNFEGPITEQQALGFKPLDAVKEEIKKTITQEKCHVEANTYFENLYRQMSEKKSFDEVAKTSLSDGVAGAEKVLNTDFFQSEMAPEEFGYPESQQVRDAMALAVGDFCGPYEHQDGFLIFKVVDKKESKLPGSWKEVRETVEKEYRIREAPALALKEIEALRQKVLGLVPKKTFEEALKENGITAKNSGSISKRTRFMPGIGSNPAILEKVFALKEDEISEVIPLNKVADTNSSGGYNSQGVGGFLFAQVTKRVPAEMTQYGLEHESFKKYALHSKKMKIFVQWLQSVQKEANIKKLEK